MDTNTDLILQESDRAKLDDIVSKMQSNKESDDNIRWVVNDFKSKYGKSQGAEPSDASIPQVDLSKPGQPSREVASPELQDLTKQFTTPEKPIDIPIGGAKEVQKIKKEEAPKKETPEEALKFAPTEKITAPKVISYEEKVSKANNLYGIINNDVAESNAALTSLSKDYETKQKQFSDLYKQTSDSLYSTIDQNPDYIKSRTDIQKSVNDGTVKIDDANKILNEKVNQIILNNPSLKNIENQSKELQNNYSIEFKKVKDKYNDSLKTNSNELNGLVHDIQSTYNDAKEKISSQKTLNDLIVKDISTNPNFKNKDQTPEGFVKAQSALDNYFSSLKNKGYNDEQIQQAIDANKDQWKFYVGNLDVRSEKKKQDADLYHKTYEDNELNYISSITGTFDKQVTNFIADIPKFAAILGGKAASLITGKESDITLNPIYKLGTAIANFGEEYFYDNPKYKEAYGTKLMETAGGLAPWVLAPEIMGAAKFAKPAISALEATNKELTIGKALIEHAEHSAPMAVTAGFSAATEGYQNTYNTATDAHVLDQNSWIQKYGNGKKIEDSIAEYNFLKERNPNTVAYDNFKLNIINGAPFLFSPALTISRLNKVTGGWIENILKDGFLGGVDGLAQGAIMKGFDNLAAKESYEQSRHITEGAIDSGIHMGIINGFMSAITAALTKKRASTTPGTIDRFYIDKALAEVKLKEKEISDNKGDYYEKPNSIIVSDLQKQMGELQDQLAKAPTQIAKNAITLEIIDLNKRLIQERENAMYENSHNAINDIQREYNNQQITQLENELAKEGLSDAYKERIQSQIDSLKQVKSGEDLSIESLTEKPVRVVYEDGRTGIIRKTDEGDIEFIPDGNTKILVISKGNENIKTLSDAGFNTLVNDIAIPKNNELVGELKLDGKVMIMGKEYKIIPNKNAPEGYKKDANGNVIVVYVTDSNGNKLVVGSDTPYGKELLNNINDIKEEVPVVKEAVKVEVPKNVVEEEIDGLAQKIKSGAELTERESQIKASMPEQVNAALVRIGEKPIEVTAEKVTEAPVKEENLNLFNGKNKVVTNATKTYERVKVFKGDILAAIKEDADRGVQEAVDILANKNYDRFTRANEYIYNKFKGDYDAVKFENVGREGGQVPTEYLDLGEKKFYSTDRTHAKLYSLSDRSSKYAFKEEAVASEGKPAEPVAAEVKVEAPKVEVKTEPAEGDKIELAPQIEGGIPRRMVFKDGEWHQEVGRETSPVGMTVKKQAQAEWMRQNEAKPAEVAPEAVPTAKKEERPEVVKHKESVVSILGPKPVEAAAEAPITPAKTYTAETVSEVNPNEFEREDAKKAASTAKNVVTAVNKLVKQTTGNPLNLHLHTDQRTYGDAVENAGGTRQDATSKGFYLGSDGTIHINMETATPETIMHEGFHPILDYLADKNSDIIDSLHKQLESLKGGKEFTERAERAYKDKSEVTIKKEAITDFIAHVADGRFEITRSNFEAVRDFVINALKKIGLDLSKPIESITDLKELAQNISEKFKTGEEITIKDVKGINELDIQNGDVVATAKIPEKIKADESKPIQYSNDIDKELGREGIMKESKRGNLSDISGKYMTTTMSDKAMVGNAKHKSVFYFKQGGVLYPLLMKKLGLNRVWASLAKSKMQSLIDNLKVNDDGYSYIGIMSMGKTSHMSNIDTFNFVFDVIENETKDRKSELTKQILINEINKAYKVKYKTGKSIEDAVGKPKINMRMSITEIKNAILKNISHSESAFELRRSFLQSLLGEAKAKEGRLKTVPNYNEIAKMTEEPIIANVDNGDVVAYMKVKKADLKLIKTNPSEVGHHKSYEYAIESSSPIEYVLLNKPVHVSEIYPEFINKSGNKVSFEEAKAKYGEEKARRTHARNVVLSAPSEKVPQWSRAEKPAEMPMTEQEVVPKAKVPGFNRGVERVNEVAEKYKAKTGIKKSAHPPVERIYGDVSKNIADAYVEMKHDPSNPKVKKAYDAMIQETKDQFNHIVEEGIDIVRYTGEGEPYKSSKEMLADVKKGRLMFLPSEEAFGTPEAKEKFKDNIGLQNSGVKLKDGYELTNSELFRVVHDYFGHGLLGNEFGAIGEENATLQHLSLFSDDAAPAVIAQTRGQNSWVNFSGINAEALDLYKQARNAEKQGNSALAKNLRTKANKLFTFAEPKIGLLPDIYNFQKYETAKSINERIQQGDVIGKQDVGHAVRPDSLPVDPEVARKGSFERRDQKESRRIGDVDVNVSAVYKPLKSVVDGIKKRFKNATIDNEILEITGDPKAFHKFISDSRLENPKGASVFVYPKERNAQSDGYDHMRLFITPDGKTGVALKEDGDLVSGFSSPSAGKKNRVPQLLLLAIKEGATKADCFHTVLPDYYSTVGFRAISKVKFDPKEQPPAYVDDYGRNQKGWNEEDFKEFNDGQPDVVHLAYDGGDRATIQDKVGQFDDYTSYTENTIDHKDYDTAAKVTTQASKGETPQFSRGERGAEAGGAVEGEVQLSKGDREVDDKLVKWIKDGLDKGLTDEEIGAILKDYKYTDEKINNLIEQSKTKEYAVQEPTTEKMGAYPSGDEGLGGKEKGPGVGQGEQGAQPAKQGEKQVLTEEPILKPEGNGETVGISHESLSKVADKLGLEKPERGTVLTAEEYTKRGQEFLKAGVDPNKIAIDFIKDGKISADTLSVVKAHYANLVKNLTDIYNKFGKNNQKYKDAEKLANDWQKDVVKPMATEWGATGRTIQGETDVDTSSFVSMERTYKESSGKSFTEDQSKEATALSEKVKDLEAKYKELAVKLDATISKSQTKEGKVKFVKVRANEIADIIRKGKLSKPDVFSAATPASLVWDTALEIAAKTIEKTGDLVQALSDGLEHIKNSDWYKSSDKKEEAEAAFKNYIEGIQYKKHLSEEERFDDLKTRFVDKQDSNFNIEDIKDIWAYAKKTYLDKGSSFKEMLSGVSTDLGLTSKQVLTAIAQPKGAKVITDAMYTIQNRRAMAIRNAKAWLNSVSMPKHRKFLNSLPSAFFALKTFGHGTVGFVTHAGLNIFKPTEWKHYFPNFFNQYKFAFGSTAKYEQAMEHLQNDPQFTFWKRAGLAVDPTKIYSEYEGLGKYFGKIGMAGERGFNALKTYRLDLAKGLYDGLSASEKADPESAKKLAALINHSTGSSEVKTPSWSSKVFFAPKLEVSRWQRLITDPTKATETFLTWNKATPSEKMAAKMTAKRAGETMAIYATLLAANYGLASLVNSDDNKPNLFSPTDSDFLKFKMGGNNVDLTGGIIPTIIFISNLINQTKIAVQGTTKRQMENPQQVDYKKIMQQTRKKFSPIAGLVTDLLTGTDAIGKPLPYYSVKPKKGDEPYTTKEYLGEQFSPIPVSEGIRVVAEGMKDKGMSNSDIKKLYIGIGTAIISGLTGAKITSDYDEKTKKPSKSTSKATGNVVPAERSGTSRSRVVPAKR